jgi:hypothetical protein
MDLLEPGAFQKSLNYYKTADTLIIMSISDLKIRRRFENCIYASLYNTHGHKLRIPRPKKAQFVTALGIA